MDEARFFQYLCQPQPEGDDPQQVHTGLNRQLARVEHGLGKMIKPAVDDGKCYADGHEHEPDNIHLDYYTTNSIMYKCPSSRRKPGSSSFDYAMHFINIH